MLEKGPNPPPKKNSCLGGWGGGLSLMHFEVVFLASEKQRGEMREEE